MVSTHRDATDLYPSWAFDPAGKAAIQLIEVASDGGSRRVEVTEELVKTYIERDYDVSRAEWAFGACGKGSDD